MIHNVRCLFKKWNTKFVLKVQVRFGSENAEKGWVGGDGKQWWKQHPYSSKDFIYSELVRLFRPLSSLESSSQPTPALDYYFLEMLVQAHKNMRNLLNENYLFIIRLKNYLPVVVLLSTAYNLYYSQMKSLLEAMNMYSINFNQWDSTDCHWKSSVLDKFVFKAMDLSN